MEKRRCRRQRIRRAMQADGGLRKWKSKKLNKLLERQEPTFQMPEGSLRLLPMFCRARCRILLSVTQRYATLKRNFKTTTCTEDAGRNDRNTRSDKRSESGEAMTITPEQMIEWLEERLATAKDRAASGRTTTAEMFAHEIKTLAAILAHIRRTTDPKWKLVPVEPTEEMVGAGINAGLKSEGVIMQLDSKRLDSLKSVGIEIKAFKYTGLDEYRAMLAAAPTQEE